MDWGTTHVGAESGHSLGTFFAPGVRKTDELLYLEVFQKRSEPEAAVCLASLLFVLMCLSELTNNSLVIVCWICGELSR